MQAELPVALHKSSGEVCKKWVREHFPGVDGTRVDHHYRCMYTSVAGSNQEFVLGAHFDDPDHVIVGCAFGGEGFKFSPVVGEALAQMAVGEAEPVDGMNSTFALARFAPDGNPTQS